MPTDQILGSRPASTRSSHPNVLVAVGTSGTSRLRWVPVAVFVLFSTLNYLDRQLLAALAPTLKSEFGMSNATYGQLISAFSLVYAFATPVVGWIVDVAGLNLGSMLAVGIWSTAGIVTGWAHTFRMLLGCRIGLGLAEAGGIPCSSKVGATYLKPRELGIGTAVQSVGITLGSIAAPLMVAAIAPHYGWRAVFVVCGGIGFIWVLLWRFTSSYIAPAPSPVEIRRAPLRDLIQDPRLWGIALANSLVMTVYSLWANWTTIYLVQDRHLSQLDANQYFAWIPPVFASLGGFFGGWLAFRRIRDGQDPIAERVRICGLLAPVLLATAAVPFVRPTSLAVAVVSLSFFGCMSILTNLQVIPIDIFGPGHAAFATSVLTCSYALMQSIISPVIGMLVDHLGFSFVCMALSVLPLAGVWLLRRTVGRPRGSSSRPWMPKPEREHCEYWHPADN